MAHSMGCRVLKRAIEILGECKIAQNIVMAAPDIAYDHFNEAMVKFAGRAGRITVYCSENDDALWASETIMLGRKDRAGRHAASIKIPATVSNVDVVDTSAVANTRPSGPTGRVRRALEWVLDRPVENYIPVGGHLGHSDFATSAIDDLRMLAWFNCAASERGLLLDKHEGEAFWRYRNDADAAKNRAAIELLHKHETVDRVRDMEPAEFVRLEAQFDRLPFNAKRPETKAAAIRASEDA